MRNRFDGLVPYPCPPRVRQTFPPRVARNQQSSSPMPSICADLRHKEPWYQRCCGPFVTGVPACCPPCPSSVHVRPILARRLSTSTSPTLGQAIRLCGIPYRPAIDQPGRPPASRSSPPPRPRATRPRGPRRTPCHRRRRSSSTVTLSTGFSCDPPVRDGVVRCPWDGTAVLRMLLALKHSFESRRPATTNG